MRVMMINDAGGQKLIDVSTDEKLHLVALAIVNDRFNSGYWHQPQKMDKPKMSRMEISKLKDEDVKNFGLMKLREYTDFLKKFEKETERYQLIKDCIENKDGPAAFKILEYRSQFQGEDMSIVDVRDYY